MKKIFSVILILFGSFFIIFVMMERLEGTSEETALFDFLYLIPFGILPVYFGLKLFEQNPN